MQLVKSVPVPCLGVDHMDFTADGDARARQLRVLRTDGRRRPRTPIDSHDDRSPEPRRRAETARRQAQPRRPVFYVADMNSNGVWEIDARPSPSKGSSRPGAGAHGLYPSRNAISLRHEPRRGNRQRDRLLDAPDRADLDDPGRQPRHGRRLRRRQGALALRVANTASVYAISTTDGHVIATIPVGNGPHGLCVWPQPGRYSIGHTGITR